MGIRREVPDLLHQLQANPGDFPGVDEDVLELRDSRLQLGGKLQQLLQLLATPSAADASSPRLSILCVLVLKNQRMGCLV